MSVSDWSSDVCSSDLIKPSITKRKKYADGLMKFIFSLYRLNKSAARRNITKAAPEMMIHVKGLIALLALLGMHSSLDSL